MLKRNEQGKEMYADCGNPRSFQGCKNCFHNPFRDEGMEPSPEIQRYLAQRKEEERRKGSADAAVDN